MVFRIGAVTSGQSPRVDVVPGIKKLIPSNCEWVEKGSLDGLTLDEVGELAPKGNETPMVTRMRDGAQAVVSLRSIAPLMQKKISELNDEGVDLIVVLSGGYYPEYESVKPVIFPHRLVPGVLHAVAMKGKLGLMVPLATQIDFASECFGDIGSGVIAVAVSPYLESKKMMECAKELHREEIDLILLWCFGYNLEMTQAVKNVTCKPVVSVATLLARNLAEFCC